MPRRTRKSGLVQSGLRAAQRVDHRNPPPLRYFARQQFRLIEAALPAAMPVHRNRNHQIVSGIYRQCPLQQFRQRSSQRPHFGVFKKMDQLAQRAFVEAETDRAVEAARAGAAQRADALCIQRKTILERGVAGSAKVLCFKRSRGFEATTANRDPGKPLKRDVADAALGREKKRKKSVGDRAEAEGGRSR